eukprot:3465328-Pyramimonas_sp.AAC.1
MMLPGLPNVQSKKEKGWREPDGPEVEPAEVLEVARVEPVAARLDLVQSVQVMDPSETYMFHSLELLEAKILNSRFT